MGNKMENGVDDTSFVQTRPGINLNRFNKIQWFNKI